MVWKRFEGKRSIGFEDPGALRDELNALVLAGRKTATAGLWRVEYEPEGEDIEAVGERLVLLDSDEEPIALLEVTRVGSYPFASVPWELARDEGEGFESVEDFRAAYRRQYAQQGVVIADDDRIICVWFRVIDELVAGDRAPYDA